MTDWQDIEILPGAGLFTKGGKENEKFKVSKVIKVRNILLHKWFRDIYNNCIAL